MTVIPINRSRSPRAPRRAWFSAAAVLLMTASTGCGSTVPVDTAGTLSRVRDGELRVGITHNPPWTDTSPAAGMVGSEVQLVERFAAKLDADISWSEGSEAILADSLHRGELDLVIGGFTDDTPWTQDAAITAPYLEQRDDHGEMKKHVVLTRPGENRFLMTMESFLRNQRSTP